MRRDLRAFSPAQHWRTSVLGSLHRASLGDTGQEQMCKDRLRGCESDCGSNIPGARLAAVLGFGPASLMAMAAMFRSGADPLRFTTPADSICVHRCDPLEPCLACVANRRACGGGHSTSGCQVGVVARTEACNRPLPRAHLALWTASGRVVRSSGRLPRRRGSPVGEGYRHASGAARVAQVHGLRQEPGALLGQEDRLRPLDRHHALRRCKR